MAKKRINIYVEEETYKEFKSVCSVTGETVTSVLHYAMKEYIDSIKMILEAGDKDRLMEMVKKKLEVQMESMEKEIEQNIQAKMGE